MSSIVDTKTNLEDSKPRLDLTKLEQALNKKNESKELWRGRKIHVAKNKSRIVIQMFAAAVFIIIGAMFSIANHPFIGAVFIGSGLGCAHESYNKSKAPNHLEEALKYLTKKNDLDQLPTLKSWRTRNGTICPISSMDMRDSVMALKQKGRTFAVAISYFDPEYRIFDGKTEGKQIIKVFDYKCKFSPYVSLNFDKAFEVVSSIDAREGRLLEKVLEV